MVILVDSIFIWMNMLATCREVEAFQLMNRKSSWAHPCDRDNGTSAFFPVNSHLEARAARRGHLDQVKHALVCEWKANLCQAKATECARMAEIAGSSEVAGMYRKMEQRWLEFAAKAQAADNPRSHPSVRSI
jgi:hypothetical protein